MKPPKQKRVKKVKGWCVLGADGNLHIFGSLRGRGGSFSIFAEKGAAQDMAVAASWTIKKCEIIIK